MIAPLGIILIVTGFVLFWAGRRSASAERLLPMYLSAFFAALGFVLLTYFFGGISQDIAIMLAAAAFPLVLVLPMLLHRRTHSQDDEGEATEALSQLRRRVNSQAPPEG